MVGEWGERPKTQNENENGNFACEKPCFNKDLRFVCVHLLQVLLANLLTILSNLILLAVEVNRVMNRPKVVMTNKYLTSHYITFQNVVGLNFEEKVYLSFGFPHARKTDMSHQGGYKSEQNLLTYIVKVQFGETGIFFVFSPSNTSLS